MRSCILFLCLFILIPVAQGHALTLNEAVEQGLEETIDLKIARLSLENARLDYEKTRASNLLAESKQMELQGEYLLFQAQENFTQTQNLIIISVVQQFYQLYQGKHNLLIKEKELHLQERLLKEVEAQFASGHKGSLDLLQQQTSHDNAIIALEQARNDYRQLEREFLNKLALEGPVELTLPSPLADWPITEEEALETALANSKAMELQDLQLEMAQWELEKARVSSTPSLEIKKLENNVSLAHLRKSKEQEQLLQSVTRDFFLHAQGKRNINLARQSLEQAQRNYDIIISQKEVGLVTENERLQAAIALLQAEQGLMNTKSAYHISRYQLQHSMGLELEGL